MQTRKTDIEGWEMGAAAVVVCSLCARSMCSGSLTCRTLSRYRHTVFHGEIWGSSSTSDKVNRASAFLDDIIKIENSAVKCCLLARLRTCGGFLAHLTPRDAPYRPTACVRKLREHALNFT